MIWTQTSIRVNLHVFRNSLMKTVEFSSERCGNKLCVCVCVCVCNIESLSSSRDILEDPDFILSLTALSSRPITYQLFSSHGSSPPSSLPPPPPPPDFPTFSQLTPDPQILSSGTAERKEQRGTADSEGTAARWRNNSPTQSTAHAEHVPADLSEEVLLNTLQNLMMEAVRGELVLTARPRAVIQPPVCTR